MKYFMMYVQGVDRLQQSLWFIENYQDIRYRQADINWLKDNKRFLYDEYNIGLQICNWRTGFMWVSKYTPMSYFIRNSIKEVFYNTDTINIGELK